MEHHNLIGDNMPFRVTKHFNVYGNKDKDSPNRTRYVCKTCKAAVFTPEDAESHYGQHTGTAPSGEMSDEEAVSALNFLARRVVAQEEELIQLRRDYQDLEDRHNRLLENMEYRNKAKLSEEFRRVYRN